MTEQRGGKQHWEQVYRTKATDEVSWYQEVPAISLRLIQEAVPDHDAPIIDVGGGASRLVDHLLDAGYGNLSVLDISATAIAAAQQRLGERAGQVTWYEDDITRFRPGKTFALWHDRAVFHFLTQAADRKAYVHNLDACLSEDGHVIIATFSRNGPRQCSGLDIVQYDEAAISAVLGPGFELVDTESEIHITPANKEQAFSYFRFRRR